MAIYMISLENGGANISQHSQQECNNSNITRIPSWTIWNGFCCWWTSWTEPPGKVKAPLDIIGNWCSRPSTGCSSAWRMNLRSNSRGQRFNQCELPRKTPFGYQRQCLHPSTANSGNVSMYWSCTDINTGMTHISSMWCICACVHTTWVHQPTAFQTQICHSNMFNLDGCFAWPASVSDPSAEPHRRKTVHTRRSSGRAIPNPEAKHFRLAWGAQDVCLTMPPSSCFLSQANLNEFWTYI